MERRIPIRRHSKTQSHTKATPQQMTGPRGAPATVARQRHNPYGKADSDPPPQQNPIPNKSDALAEKATGPRGAPATVARQRHNPYGKADSDPPPSPRTFYHLHNQEDKKLQPARTPTHSQRRIGIRLSIASAPLRKHSRRGDILANPQINSRLTPKNPPLTPAFRKNQHPSPKTNLHIPPPFANFASP